MKMSKEEQKFIIDRYVNRLIYQIEHSLQLPSSYMKDFNPLGTDHRADLIKFYQKKLSELSARIDVYKKSGDFEYLDIPQHLVRKYSHEYNCTIIRRKFKIISFF